MLMFFLIFWKLYVKTQNCIFVRVEYYDSDLSEPRPRIVECISECQIVTPGSGLTQLRSGWADQRAAGLVTRAQARTDIPAETLLHYTLHITLCWPAEILYTLRPVSGSRVIVSVFLKADTAPSQVSSSSSRQWLWARVIFVNCLMITFLVGK